MEQIEILKQIEKIITAEDSNPENTGDSDENQKKHPVKDMVYLLLTFLLNILQTPFKVVATFMKNEIVDAMKKDAKLYAIIMGLMGVMFVFFSVLWLFISVAIGIYNYDNGATIFESILYSIIFQVISFGVIAILAFIAAKNIKSIKMISGISESISESTKK